MIFIVWKKFIFSNGWTVCVWEFFFFQKFRLKNFPFFFISHKLQVTNSVRYGHELWEYLFGAKNKTAKHGHQLNWWSFYIDWISFIFIFPIYYYLTLSTNLHTVNMLNVCIFREYFQYKFPHSRRYFHFIKIVFLNWTFSLLFLFRFCFVLFCLLCNVCVCKQN